MMTTVPDPATLPRLPRRGRQTAWLPTLMIVIACAALLDAVFGDRGLTRTIHSRQDLIRFSEQLARLKQDNDALRSQIHRLQRDPATIEAVARQDLGLVGPGEILVIVKDAK
jgi:cell division protein FtsB